MAVVFFDPLQTKPDTRLLFYLRSPLHHLPDGPFLLVFCAIPRRSLVRICRNDERPHSLSHNVIPLMWGEWGTQGNECFQWAVVVSPCRQEREFWDSWILEQQNMRHTSDTLNISPEVTRNYERWICHINTEGIWNHEKWKGHISWADWVLNKNPCPLGSPKK